MTVQRRFYWGVFLPQYPLLALGWFRDYCSIFRVTSSPIVTCLTFIAMYVWFFDLTYNTTVSSLRWKRPDSGGLWTPLTFLLLQHIRRYSNVASNWFQKFLLTFKHANCSKFGVIRGYLLSRRIDNMATCKMTNLKILEKQVFS